MSDAVEIADLVMTYGGRRVVDGVSLTAPTGALTVVLGPNGAGKTTTIETAEGFRRPQGGSVRVLGRDPATDGSQLRPRVGVMLQAGGTWPSLRVRDTVAHASSLYAAPHPVDSLLERVGLAAVARTQYRRLSGGEQRKVALACALVGRPELVFLDEPTTGLDPGSRAAVWRLLADLRAAGVTLVMTTHLLDEAEALADHVVVVARGRVAAQGAVTTLMPERPRLRFQAPPALDLQALGAVLPRGVRAHEPSPGHYVVDGPVEPALLATITSWCAARGVLPTEVSTAGTFADTYFSLTSPAPPGNPSTTAGTQP